GDANTRAHWKIRRGSAGDFAHDLVTGDQRVPALREFAFDDMEVGAADAAGADANEDVARGGLGLGEGADLKRTCGDACRRIQDSGSHRESSRIVQTQRRLMRIFFRFSLVGLVFCGLATAQEITSPEKFFGFQLGADKKMARWDKIVEYYGVLEKQSGGRM